MVVATIVSELEPADAKTHTDDMRAAIGPIAGAEVYLTGQAATEHDLDPVFEEDLQRGEFFIALPIALALLVLAFGTLAFLLPFAFALFTIPTTLGLVWVVANFMELTTYLTNMVSLIGLGIAIDYSLLVVYRFREELGEGGLADDAIVRTMNDGRARRRLQRHGRRRSGSRCCSSCRCRSCAASASAASSSRSSRSWLR